MISLKSKANWTNISSITKRSISKGGKFLRTAKTEFQVEDGKVYVQINNWVESKKAHVFIKVDYNECTKNYMVAFYAQDILLGNHEMITLKTFKKMGEMKQYLKGKGC